MTTYRRLCALAFMFLFIPFAAFADARLDAAMDAIVTRLYEAYSIEQLRALTNEQLDPHIAPADREALATAYWQFDVNVPVVVSIMRHVKQTAPPSWLAETGFAKTGLVVKNENCVYEVWQKPFDAGRVSLGMNGFDGHRFCYFVCVGPQTPGAEVVVSNASPAGTQGRMDVGATTYTDWTELVLTEAPEALRGQVLLTTYRGRARETHLFGGFRETPFPASDAPDQTVLTWSGDPKTTQAVSWRTNTSVTSGAVRYRVKGTDGAFAETPATFARIDDRMLANDRTSHRFTGQLAGLASGTAYTYRVGDPVRGVWSAEQEFITAPENADAFSFVHLTDTHNKETAGKLLAAAYGRMPAPSLVAISGDLVDMGLHRDCWDKLFSYLGVPVARIPVVPSLGNHDDQDGLGPGVFLDQFALPDAGVPGVRAESAYAVRYANALFLVLPIGAPVETLAPWIEKELASSDATWKFGVYHFPIYTDDPEYAHYYDKQRAIWGALFDTHHLDVMLMGHTHKYYRSKPIRAGNETESFADGTVYLVSAPSVYGRFVISGRRLEYESVDTNGNVKDAFVIEK